MEKKRGEDDELKDRQRKELWEKLSTVQVVSVIPVILESVGI